MTLTQTAVLLMAVVVGALYIFVFVPNFNDCRTDGKPIRACLGHLIR